MIVLLVFITFILLEAIRPGMLRKIPELVFTLFLFVLVVAGASFAWKIEPMALYLLPFPVIVLFLDSFFPTKLSLPLYMLFLLPLAVVTDSYQPVLINIVVGGVADDSVIPSLEGRGLATNLVRASCPFINT
jgi:hypothetical protein